MDDILIVTNKITRTTLKEIASRFYSDLVKAVVDIGRGVMAVGGELHSDEERLLLEGGSSQEDLWGINIYPDKPEGEWIEFDSVINIRPSLRNRSRAVEDPARRKRIEEIVSSLIE